MLFFGLNMKLCKSCGETKPLTEFYKNNAAVDKLTRSCKICSRRQERETHKKNPSKKWEYKHRHLKTISGEKVTLKFLTSLIESQNNKCGICQVDMKTPCIDHNHTTGNVRMLLCNHCNIMLGMSRENVEILSRAISYLEKFNNNNFN